MGVIHREGQRTGELWKGIYTPGVGFGLVKRKRREKHESPHHFEACSVKATVLVSVVISLCSFVGIIHKSLQTRIPNHFQLPIKKGLHGQNAGVAFQLAR